MPESLSEVSFCLVHRLEFRIYVITVWARKETLDNATYAASLTHRVLRWFEGYFLVTYPLNKLDIVTFPSYHVSGMEHFGLINTK